MARSGEGSDLVTCTFCGKSQEQVGKLIAGPGVYICNECIQLCNDIIDEEGIDCAQAAGPPPLTDDQLRWRETQPVVAQRLARQPTVAEMAAELGWTEERASRARLGAWIATSPASSMGGDTDGLARALRGVQRQLDGLARRVAGLADNVGGDDSAE